jgi:hypothetical protein
MENIFKQASRLKLRFDLNGQLSVEQLWTANRTSLENYEQELEKQVDSFASTTRRRAASKGKEQALVELKLAIVKDVLDTLDQEDKERTDASAARANNEKILEIIARKQNAELENMSLEDLQKLIVK